MTETKHEGTIVALIAGYRYAGKSLVLQYLEQAGYSCVDNLPPRLVPDYFARGKKKGGGPWRAAVAVDLEDLVSAEDEAARDTGKSLLSLKGTLAAAGHSCKIVFLEAGETALGDRYAASPARAAGSDAAEAARRDTERSALAPARAAADLVLDSSYASPADERDRIVALMEGERSRVETRVEISSFGHKFGIPQGDVVVDVRFIPNPYYVAALRPLSGKDKACADYVLGGEGARGSLEALISLVSAMEPAYALQGRPALRIRIGCTGGRHRSVAMAEALGAALSERGLDIAISHRDLA